MNEFFNFHDIGILIQFNWIWLAVAFLIGAWVGFTTCIPSKSSR